MSGAEEPFLPEAVWNAAVDPTAPPLEFESADRVDEFADWLEQHCTQPDGSPLVLHPWQREILANALARTTAPRPRRIDRPACPWRPSSGAR